MKVFRRCAKPPKQIARHESVATIEVMPLSPGGFHVLTYGPDGQHALTEEVVSSPLIPEEARDGRMT